MLTIAQVQNPVVISGTVTVSASSGAPITVSGTTHIDNTVLNVTSSVSAPVYVQVTASMPVSQSNIPAGTMTVSQSNTPAGVQQVSQASALAVLVSGSASVSQNSAWNTLVSGVVGITQSGTLNALVSGVVGVVQSGAFSMLVSGSSAGPVWVTSSVASPVYVQVTASVPVSMSNVATVTSTFAAPVWVTQSLPVTVSSSQFIARDVVARDAALPVRAILPTEHLSAFGEFVVAQKVAILPLNFNYDWPVTHINTAFCTATFVSGGGLTVSSSMAQLSSSTNSSGSSILESKAAVRYIAGTGLFSSYTALFTSGVANSRQLAGMGDAFDGMFWGYSGTQFGATVRVSGVDIFVGTGSFSNDHLDGTGFSLYSLAPTSLELFKVEVGWHGSGPIKFYAFDVAQGRWVLGHVVSGEVVSPRILNPTLPLHFEVKNTGNTSNVILKTASAGIYRESVSPSDIPLDALIVSSGSSLSVGATELPVISIQVTGTINGQPNRARVQLQSISVADAGGAGTVMFVRARLNPTTLTGPTFVPYNTGTSVCNFDTVASAVAGGSEVLGTVASGQANTFQDLTNLGIVLNPGDILSLTVQHVAGGASTNLLRCTLRELHTG